MKPSDPPNLAMQCSARMTKVLDNSQTRSEKSSLAFEPTQQGLAETQAVLKHPTREGLHDKHSSTSRPPRLDDFSKFAPLRNSGKSDPRQQTNQPHRGPLTLDFEWAKTLTSPLKNIAEL